ncbi:hypothetical protein [Streptomyces sp. NPDC029004]|uniref:hypothetical protein n=1 Tax=Streptomyces sp. NPDC029004 TaxID=3154490 RepID=UPI0033E1132B
MVDVHDHWQGSRLYAAAADLARQRAAALFDVEGECADGAYDTALRAADIAGDTALGANVLAFWSAAAYNTGRLHDAVAMASTGLTAVRGSSTPRVEALLTSRRGRARAHLGDPACWADFDRAEDLLAQADSHEDPDWAYWFDTAELLGPAHPATATWTSRDLPPTPSPRPTPCSTQAASAPTRCTSPATQTPTSSRERSNAHVRQQGTPST